MKPSEIGRPISYLDNVEWVFPELTIVASHIGHPWTEVMMALATKYENVYVDTSAYKPKRSSTFSPRTGERWSCSERTIR